MVKYVTNTMLIDNFLRNYSYLRQKLDKMQSQMASGKYFEYPSDDAGRMVKSMELKEDYSSAVQYKDNISEARSWLTVTSGAVDSVLSVIQRAQELATEGADGNKTDVERQGIAEEIEQLLEGVVQAGNTNHRGRYIFAGYNTYTAPFSYTEDSQGRITAVSYNGDTGVRRVGVGYDITMEVNTIGAGGDGTTHRGNFVDPIAGVNVFNTLIGLRDDLLNGNISSITNQRMRELSECQDNVLFNQVQIGAKSNRLDALDARYDEQMKDYNTLIDKNENVNYAELFSEFQSLDATYQATLATGAKIIQPSLANYL